MDNGLIKGQGLVLVTGKKGSGKSHFVTSQIKFIRDNFPDHTVYADIDGLEISGVNKSPDDWQTAPKNSTVIYDEAQRLPWADNSSAKINSDPRVREMTMIRHENKNIVLITQDPMFIHSALRKLVDVHYHISHPFKDGKPKVFKFIGAMGTIDDKGAYKSHAVETFTHKLDPDTSKLYKSVDVDASHDQKKKIPKRIIYMSLGILAIILLGIPIALWGVGKVYGFISSADERGDEMITSAQSNAETIGGANNGASGFNQPNAMQSPDQLTRAQLDELYKKYLDDYTVEVAEHDAIRPASIMANGGRCKAYNKFGDGLNITQEKCNDMLKNPDTIPKPRNVSRSSPIGASQQNTSVQNTPERDFINNPPPPNS